MNLDRLLEFSKLLTAFQKIERVIYVPGTDRSENDTEHSYHLALMAWYILSTQKSSLDLNLVLRYALVHDLVEIYAGDTYIYSTDPGHLESKHAREQAAAIRLQQEFSEFSDLHKLIEEYERRETPESKFVYALDKILPLILNHEDGGRGWKERGVTLEMLIEEKTKKVALSPEVTEYFNELVQILTKNENDFFPPRTTQQ